MDQDWIRPNSGRVTVSLTFVHSYSIFDLLCPVSTAASEALSHGLYTTTGWAQADGRQVRKVRVLPFVNDSFLNSLLVCPLPALLYGPRLVRVTSVAVSQPRLLRWERISRIRAHVRARHR